jgi:hypothetical protein
MNIGTMHETAMNIVYLIATIITMSVEIFLRPQFGTTYFPPPMVFISALMLVFATAFFGLITMATSMIPFVRIAGPSGMFGMFGLGAFTSAYFIASIAHGFRLWRRMIHMELEQVSAYEGDALPFFRLLPKGGRTTRNPDGWPRGQSPPPPFAIKLAGHWQDESLIANRGVCEMKLEIRRMPLSQFAGFSNLLHFDGTHGSEEGRAQPSQCPVADTDEPGLGGHVRGVWWRKDPLHHRPAHQLDQWLPDDGVHRHAVWGRPDRRPMDGNQLPRRANGLGAAIAMKRRGLALQAGPRLPKGECTWKHFDPTITRLSSAGRTRGQISSIARHPRGTRRHGVLLFLRRDSAAARSASGPSHGARGDMPLCQGVRLLPRYEVTQARSEKD